MGHKITNLLQAVCGKCRTTTNTIRNHGISQILNNSMAFRKSCLLACPSPGRRRGPRPHHVTDYFKKHNGVWKRTAEKYFYSKSDHFKILVENTRIFFFLNLVYVIYYNIEYFYLFWHFDLPYPPEVVYETKIWISLYNLIYYILYGLMKTPLIMWSDM